MQSDDAVNIQQAEVQAPIQALVSKALENGASKATKEGNGVTIAGHGRFEGAHQ
jgi:hypothetical protein